MCFFLFPYCAQCVWWCHCECDVRNISRCVCLITWLDVDWTRAPPSLSSWTHWVLYVWQPVSDTNITYSLKISALICVYLRSKPLVKQVNLIGGSETRPGFIGPPVVILSFRHFHIITEADENLGLSELLYGRPLTQLHKKKNSLDCEDVVFS